MADWSKYKKVEANASNPWSKYQVVEQATPPPFESGERNPDISWDDRAIAKNLAQSPEKQLEFIKSKYPGLEVKLIDGEVHARRGPSDTFTAMDPSGLDREDLNDLGDTVASGVTSTLGMIGGAAAGALAGPAGAIAGGIGGTGVAGAATEGFRQKLGKALGIPQEVSGSDMAMAGGANVLGAATLGTGAVPAALLKTKLGQMAAQGETQGAIRAGWNKAIPAATKFWTGVSDDALKLYTNPVTRAEVDALAAMPKDEVGEALRTKITGDFQDVNRKVGKQYFTSIDEAVAPVSVRPLKEKLAEHYKNLKSDYVRLPNDDSRDAVKAARETYMNLFQSGGKKVGDDLMPSDAFKLQQQLKDRADLKKVKPGVSPRFSSNATQEEKELSNVLLDGYNGIKSSIDESTEGVSGPLRDEYATLQRIRGDIAPALASDGAAYSKFTNIDGKSNINLKAGLRKLSERTGKSYDEDLNKLQAADYFGSGSWTPRSTGGTTSTSRSGVAGGVGASVGSVAGGLMFGPVGAGLGAASGLAVGGASASPQALKYGIRSTDWLRYLADQTGRGVSQPGATPLLRETIVQSPWDEL